MKLQWTKKQKSNESLFFDKRLLLKKNNNPPQHLTCRFAAGKKCRFPKKNNSRIWHAAASCTVPLFLVDGVEYCKTRERGEGISNQIHESHYRHDSLRFACWKHKENVPLSNIAVRLLSLSFVRQVFSLRKITVFNFYIWSLDRALEITIFVRPPWGS